MKATQSTDSSGLGSLQGIRWLLAVGALVLAVSVYRLVESQWAGMSVAAQFLTLATGSFGVFAVGDVLRNRMRLPIAGSALTLLFSILVPVLSWGATYLDVLASPTGAVVYGVSMAVLLVAFRRSVRQVLRYDGLLYPAAFGALTVSLPLLSLLRLGSSGYLAASLGLGAVLHFGAQHINRFLFHRDRRDGVDRPIHALPFVALAVLYVASVRVIGLPPALFAIPLLIVGIALVAAGEEYYYALIRSLRARPSEWPRRSVALLSVGFAAMAVSGPLSFLDESFRAPAVVFTAMALLLFRWSFRYENLPAHLSAMCASLIGYQFLPTLMPKLARDTAISLTDVLGLVEPAAKISFAHLGLAVVFAVLGMRARRAHAVGAVLHLMALVSLSGLAGATIVAPLALALALVTAFATGRREWLVAANVAFGASILAWGGDTGMVLLAVAFIGVALAVREKYVLVPAFFWALVIAVSGLASYTNGGAFEVFLAGVLFAVLGHRLRASVGVLSGLAALSLGAHGLLAFTYGAPLSFAVVATQAFFVLSVLLWRRSEGTWEMGAHLSMIAHGALGAFWLFLAVTTSTIAVTIEPVIVAVFGWAILSHGVRERDDVETALGLGFLVSYAPIQLAAMGWVESIPVLMLIALGGVLIARMTASQTLVPVAERFLRFWRIAAVVTALAFVGVDAAAVAVAVVLLGALSGRVPYRSLLLPLGHGLVLFERSAYEFFPLALAQVMTTGFPWFAALAFAWIAFAEASKDGALRLWTTALECIVVSGFFIGFAPVPIFTPWDHAALLLVAGAFAMRHAARSFRNTSLAHAWAMHAWIGIAALVGIYAGWITFGNGRAPYVLLAAGSALYGLAHVWKRYTQAAPLASSSFVAGQGVALLGGLVALVRLQSVPLFLASLFYLLLASRETKRVVASVLSAGFMGFGLLAIAWSHGVGVEFYALAPGFTLVALALLLSEEMGPRWSRHIFTAGAVFIYATPVLALHDEITWAWQAILLLLSVGFGAASFWLRSRPLLSVSTGALVIDLACFVIMIRATEPMLLWVGGVFLGTALMTCAAYLEYRHEGLAQRIRVFGRELAHWY